MADKLMFIEVRGTAKRWCFNFYGDPRYLGDWRADGLEVNVIENTIPLWVAKLGLTRAWCFSQDLFNFKNPWSGK
jgi:hypothetical protein